MPITYQLAAIEIDGIVCLHLVSLIIQWRYILYIEELHCLGCVNHLMAVELISCAKTV